MESSVNTEARKPTKSERRRREMLQVAADLFLDAGFDVVSIDAIIERSGGSKASLYKEFGGKEKLFSEAVGARCRTILSPLLSDIPTTKDIRTGLRDFCLSFLTSVLSREALSLHRAIIAEAERFPELAEAFYLSGPQTVYNVLTTYFAHLQEEGVIVAGDPARFARLFHGMVLWELQMTHLFQSRPLPTRDDLVKRIDEAIDILLSGIGA